MNRPYEAIIKEAADYAKEKNKAVAIYQTPEAPGGFAFIELPAPGIPILEVVSPAYRHSA